MPNLIDKYQLTLDYMYAQLPMYHRVGAAAFKKDLTNTRALCAHLGNPQDHFPTIHVAGTNGKGSVTHLLAAICQAAGLKTGIYVSPHYKDFRERIRVDGTYIPRQRVIDFVDNNRTAIETIAPSFFEMCVAMAFDHFNREKVDIAIIEVGLGGRLDSTNVITPLLSVITNISYDHTDMLGNTLALIAGEKAGIIKPYVPVVIGETQAETTLVFIQKAHQENAPIVFADQHFKVETVQEMLDLSVFKVSQDGQIIIPELPVDLAGPFQQKNITTAVQAAYTLHQLPDFQRLIQQKSDLAFFPNALLNGWKNLRARTRFQGRWQVIGQHPTVLCDSAHNEGGLSVAFAKVATLPHQKLHVVTGFVNDKDLSKAFVHFPKEATYYFAKANIPRGLEATKLQSVAAEYALHGRAYASVRNALRAARRRAAPDDLIVVIGSIFVVAEVI